MGTIIRLFLCVRCGSVLSEEDTGKENPCGCGGRMFKYASPTMWNVVRFFFFHPKMIGLWFKENVLKRNS